MSVTCKSGPAKPAAKIIWEINGEEPAESFLGEYKIEVPFMYKDDKNYFLKTSSRSLHFIAEEHHFVNGMIKLRCTAVIQHAFSMNSEEKLTLMSHDHDKRSRHHPGIMGSTI